MYILYCILELKKIKITNRRLMNVDVDKLLKNPHVAYFVN